MPDTVAKARELIRDRISEIDAERKQLEQSLAALTGKNGTRRGPGRPRGSSNGSARTTIGRAPRGQRRQQVIEHVTKNPGARPSDIANALGVSANQVHGLITKLKADKLVKKQDKGYAITANVTPQSNAGTASSK